MSAARSSFHPWTIPTALALITMAGLLAALIGEGGVWWALSWVALAVPCVCSVFYLIRGTLGASIPRL